MLIKAFRGQGQLELEGGKLRQELRFRAKVRWVRVRVKLRLRAKVRWVGLGLGLG